MNSTALSSQTAPAISVTDQQLEKLRSQLDGELLFDELTRKLYSTDASVYQELPRAVAVAKTESDIQTLIQFAGQFNIGLIPRTAGTSLAGQVVGSGIVVDVSKYFTQILEINEAEQWVRVQPGVIRDELNQELAKRGLMFGPETSTANRAMIGGMVGNNSCGSNSIVYGSTRDHLLELRGFLSDGSESVFRAVTRDEFHARCHSNRNPFESAIYRGVRDLLNDTGARSRIQAEFPKPTIHRRNTGYALDELVDTEPFSTTENQVSKPFDFCKLIAGSEGTLFFVTEIKLHCDPLPPPINGVVCAHFQTLEQSLLAVQIAMSMKPYSCELMDDYVLRGAARNIEQRKNREFVQGDPAAILMIEFRGGSRAEVESKATELERQLKSAELGYHYPVLFENDAKRVWALRKAGLGVIFNTPGDRKPVTVVEDTAVAIEDLPSYIADFGEILNIRGMQAVHHAHAGAGELHLRPQINLKSEQGVEQFRTIASEVATLVKKYRGSLSGEHGDGRLRAEFLPQMIGAENYELLRKIKQLWDPRNIFNPGKIIDAPAMHEHLRYRAGQPEPEITTVYDFSHEMGILRAAELCNGSGDCRKTHLSGGTMCPSYMATRNESDTTRGRANLLRHVLTHPADEQYPFNSEALKQVMDLCLGCKGCKHECPSNVDVAKLKSEFLQGYQDAKGVSRRTKAIAGFAKSMAWASKIPRLFNALAAHPWTSSVIKRYAGFASERSIPKLHSTTLRRWYQNHQPHPNAGNCGSVFLFCDEFTNYNDVPVGIAAIELLEILGFRVQLIEHAESGRAAISKGLLRMARTFADQNVKAFRELVSSEVPLIGIEPSALLSFRDEYPVLVSAELRDDAKRLAGNALLIDEFISRLISEDRISSQLFSDEKRLIRLHGHCHQKALSSLGDTVRMLQIPKNYSVKLIPSGCCGMAGSFGYEQEHYGLSMQIGELVLFPTIRSESPDVLIAAGGTSCRHQIADGTGRAALHPVEILRKALH